MALFQCFVIPPVLHHSALLFDDVSIVPEVFCCPGGVPLFWHCSVIQRVFHVPVFQQCSIAPALFCHSVGVPCSVVLCSGVTGFIVCHFLCKNLSAVCVDYLIIFQDLLRIFFATFFKSKLQKIT